MHPQFNFKLASSISLILRGLMLVCKFMFVIELARYTSPETLGIYALVVGVVAIMIYLVGAELHAFTTREVVNPKKGSDRDLHIQNHMRFVTLSCLFSLPLVWLILEGLNIRQQLSMTLLSILLISEAICQELSRYLLVLGRPATSNVLQLLRGAAWMPVAIMLIDANGQSAMKIVLASWASGSIVAALLGLWQLREFFRVPRVFAWSWLRSAFNGSRYYFIVALLTQLQTYADRFVIQFYLGESQVGLLSFYQSFANTVQTFVQTGAISILLPGLLLATQSRSWEDAHRKSKRMLITSLALASVVSVALMVGIPLVLRLIGKLEYEALLGIFPWLLLGNLFIVAGLIPHLRLYALHRDSLLMRIFLFITPLAFLGNLVLVPFFGIQGAVMVFIVTAAIQTALKYYYARIALRQEMVGTPFKRVQAL